MSIKVRVRAVQLAVLCCAHRLEETSRCSKTDKLAFFPPSGRADMDRGLDDF